jgi:RluA family pseudouridine synthase
LNQQESQDYRTLGPIITSHQAGVRLDSYLSQKFPFLTRSGWQKRLDDQEVLVNATKRKSSYILREGDAITFYHPPEAEPDVDLGIRVLWESDGVMAVFKPGNLPMHENGAYRKNTFAHVLTEAVGSQWSAVHRLDRETSGIVLCANSHLIRQRLSFDFEEKKILKEYLLIVNGIPTAPQFTNEGPLGDLTTSQIRIKKWVVPGGLDSRTDFTVEATKPSGFSLLRAFPRTGRTNQIRIHAAHAGHWILGDKLYHPEEAVFLDYWEQGKTTPFAVRTTLHYRTALHAAAVSFQHPVTKEFCRIDSPLPEDLQDLWVSL